MSGLPVIESDRQHQPAPWLPPLERVDGPPLPAAILTLVRVQGVAPRSSPTRLGSSCPGPASPARLGSVGRVAPLRPGVVGHALAPAGSAAVEHQGERIAEPDADEQG